MKVLGSLGLVLSIAGVALFATAPPESSPASPRFLTAFVACLGGASMIALYLTLLLWKWLYKRAR